MVAVAWEVEGKLEREAERQLLRRTSDTYKHTDIYTLTNMFLGAAYVSLRDSAPWACHTHTLLLGFCSA